MAMYFVLNRDVLIVIQQCITYILNMFKENSTLQKHVQYVYPKHFPSEFIFLISSVYVRSVVANLRQFHPHFCPDTLYLRFRCEVLFCFGIIRGIPLARTLIVLRCGVRRRSL